MPMDPHLAAIYNTNEDETDVEKLAAAQLAEELADDGEIDPNELSDEDAEALAKKVLESEESAEEEAEEAEEPETASAEEEEAEETEEEQEKVSAAEEEEPEEQEEPQADTEAEAQEKLAEADYLGRVMAHAYTQELRKIAAAQATEEQEEETQEKTAGKVSNFLKGVGGGAKKGAKRYGELMAGGEKRVGGGKRAGNKLRSFGKHAKGTKDRSEAMKSLAARGGTAAAAGGAAGGAAALHKHKKKAAAAQASAVDILAERRAIEILKENGIELEQPTAEEPEVKEQTKTSASEKEMQLLADAVEKRAIEMLDQAGYIEHEKPAEGETEEAE